MSLPRRLSSIALAAIRSRFSTPAENAPILPLAIRRILWIRLDHIGDVVMSLPALHSLRHNFPEAQLDVLVRPAVAPLLSDLLASWPGTHRLLTYDTIRFPERRNRWGRGAGLFRTLALIHRLRARRYDLAIEMRGDDIGRLLAWFSGAPQRVGPDRVFYEPPGVANLSFLQTHTVPLPDLAATPIHTVETDLAMLQSLGLVVAATDFRFPILPERQASVARKLQSFGIQRPVAVLHMRSNDAGRDWSAAGFAAVAEHLAYAHELDVVLTGAPRDRDYNEQVKQLTARPNIFNAAGLFTLQELPALFARSRLMVTVDTGPMHIAAMVDTPIVAIFLPQLAGIHHPYRQPDGVVIPESAELAKLSWSELKSVGANSELALAKTVTVDAVVSVVEARLRATHAMA